MALRPDRTLTQFDMSVWQSESGLPQNNVNSIAQTPDGYLWLATAEGLARFDGVKFTVFVSEKVPALRHSTITSLFVDRQGSLWIGTDGGGVAILKENAFSSPLGLARLAGERIRALCEDAQGSLWIGTFERGLYRYDGQKVTKVPVGSERIRKAVPAGPGVWVATEDAGLSYVEGATTVKRLTAAQGLPTDLLATVLIGRHGELIVGTRDAGVAFLENGAVTSVGESEGLASNRVESLSEDRDGNLWIGTGGGGLSRRTPDGRVSSLTTADGLPGNDVYSIHEDAEGSLFVGFFGAGLVRLREGPVASFSKRQGLSDDFARAVLEDGRGAVWVGTEAGLNKIEGERVTVYRQKDGLVSDRAYSVLDTGDGDIWVGTFGDGLNLIRGGRVLTLKPRQPGLIRSIHSLLKSRSGDLWIGTLVSGVYRWTPTPEAIAGGYLDGPLTPFKQAQGLASENILCLAEGKDGEIWVATNGGGLHRIQGDTVTPYGKKEGLPSRFVFALHVDGSGALWIGTFGEGLYRLKNGRISVIRARDGLFDDVIYGIVADRRGDLWMTSNRGISRTPLAELDAFADGRRTSVTHVSYDVLDGMRSRECNAGGVAASMDRAGRLWFPTVKGVVRIDPARIPSNSVVPTVHVEELVVDDAARRFGAGEPAVDVVTVPPGKERFEFRYTGLSLLIPEKVRFRYQLEGYDRRWIEAGVRRTAYYSRLPHGSYTFRVKACNNDGVWNETGASLPVVVLPRFYETLWFRLLAAALGIAAVAGAFNLRIRQHRQRERQLQLLVAERTRGMETALRKEEEARQESERQRRLADDANRAKSSFLANMSHELRTPLNAIIGYSELLEEECSQSLPDVVPDLQKIQSSAHHQLQLINSILDLSKIEAGKMELFLETVDVPALIRDVVSIVRPLVDRNRNHLVVTIAPGVEAVRADHTKLRQCLINLLSNAAKFTEGGDVNLEVRRDGASLLFRVGDSGVGMTSGEITKLFQPFSQADASTTRKYGGTGLGLAITRRFCQLMGGDVTVASEKGRGTTFTIELPMDGPANGGTRPPA